MSTMNKLASYLAMGAMFENIMGNNINPVNINNVTGELPTPPIPNGCKEYTFNDGYKCIASSQKVADEKHYKFISKK